LNSLYFSISLWERKRTHVKPGVTGNIVAGYFVNSKTFLPAQGPEKKAAKRMCEDVSDAAKSTLPHCAASAEFAADAANSLTPVAAGASAFSEESVSEERLSPHAPRKRILNKTTPPVFFMLPPNGLFFLIGRLREELKMRFKFSNLIHELWP
jgi:hypothetical protein